MPTYDYRCDACEHEWELFHSINAEPVKKCPECGKPKAKRVIGPGAGIIFRGSGFYQTDYRSDSYKKAAKAEKESHGSSKSEKSAAKSESKTESESKPAAPSKSDD
jgi:putative FmdB family regulatory protein